MRNFQYQIKISESFSKFLNFIEVYDSAASVGILAFSGSEALVLRYMIDHVSDKDEWYISIKEEINKIINEISGFNIVNENEQIPFIYPANDSLPEYYIEVEEVLPWLKKLYKTISGTKGSNVFP